MNTTRVVNSAVWAMAIAALGVANIASSFTPTSSGHRARNLEVAWNGIVVVLGLGDVPTSTGVFSARLLAGAALLLWTAHYVRGQRTATTSS